MAFSKVVRRQKIKRRIRKNITGTTSVPRLSVFRSNKQIYAQIIDDSTGKTLVSASSYKKDLSGNKVEQAAVVGKEIAENRTRYALIGRHPPGRGRGNGLCFMAVFLENIPEAVSQCIAKTFTMGNLTEPFSHGFIVKINSRGTKFVTGYSFLLI